MAKKLPADMMIRMAHAAATRKGGTFVSGVYLGKASLHRWQCAKGHDWSALFDSVVKFGRWCAACKQQKMVEDASRIATTHGGRFLSLGKSLGACTATDWECSKGHRWTTRYSRVVTEGCWCKRCKMMRKDTDDLVLHARKVAGARGGKFVTGQYLGQAEPHVWECDQGHRFERPFHYVLKLGSWCTTCKEAASGPQAMFAQAKEYAAACDGWLLSRRYRPARPLSWRCAAGHRWQGKFTDVVTARKWCAECTRGIGERRARLTFERLLPGFQFPTRNPEWLVNPSTGRRLQLDGYNEELRLAFEFQGPHHRSSLAAYKMTPDDLLSVRQRDELKRVACKARRITLIEVPDSLDAEVLPSWVYRRLNRITRLRPLLASWEGIDVRYWILPDLSWSIEDLNARAADLGGRCLETAYLGSTSKHRWQCGTCAHEWSAHWYNINQGHWCKRCGQKDGAATRISRSRYRLQHLHAHALGLVGKCLSTAFIGSNKHYQWECGICGHQWAASWTNVRRGTWCKPCRDGAAAEKRRGKSKYAIEDLRRHAAVQGGACLSTTYSNKRNRYHWSCRAGHDWWAEWGNISRGSWCKQCLHADLSRRYRGVPKPRQRND